VSEAAPHWNMWFAVMTRAVNDLFGYHTKESAELERSEALSFLTDEDGSWARRRNEIGTLIGIDGGLIREKIIAILESDDTEVPGAYRESLKHVEDARLMWHKQIAKRKAAHEERKRRAQIAAANRAGLRIARDRQLAEEKAAAALLARRLEMVARINPSDRDRLLFTALIDGGKTVRELGFAVDGEMGFDAIQKWLKKRSDIIETRGARYYLK